MADLIGEMGDLLWFLAELADVHGLTLDEIAEANIDKLRRRYPEGFSEEDSLHREG
jgi:NTP pyrophosphatase (non-canonical NTP hydrolase)